MMRRTPVGSLSNGQMTTSRSLLRLDRINSMRGEFLVQTTHEGRTGRWKHPRRSHTFNSSSSGVDERATRIPIVKMSPFCQMNCADALVQPDDR